MANIQYDKPWLHPLTKEKILDADKVTLTLQHMMFEVVTKVLPGDENMAAAEKMRWHTYAMKISKAEPLKSAALNKIKERGAKALTILGYGFLVEGINEALGETAAVDDEV